MKILMRRTHTVRPADYEAVQLVSQIEIDTDSESDMEGIEGTDFRSVGEELSARLDELLDTDVDRTLKLDGQHILDTHLWVFYEKE